MNDDLKVLLEEALAQCSQDKRREVDPVGLVHPYETAADREVAALFASCLAYGRVELLRSAITRALAPLGDSPAAYLRAATPGELDSLWPDFTYRMTRGADLRDLATAISATLSREGSLQALYVEGNDGDSPIDDRHRHLRLASGFVRQLRRRRQRTELHRGFRYLLPDPSDGSACKRLHLYFRWMARGPDAVDLGIWEQLAPSALVIPLDTHIEKLCRYLGMLKRKTPDAKAALEVTRQLAVFAPDDPLRYDFALCHLGISKRCIHRYSPRHCPQCPIESACTVANSNRIS